MKSEDFVSKERKFIRDNGPEESFNGNVPGLDDDGCIYHISRFVELDGMFSFQYKKGGGRHRFLHDLEKKETLVTPFFANDYLCEGNNIPLDMCYSDKEGVLSVLNVNFIPYLIE